MKVNYIIESRYYNGDKYAEKVDSLAELAYALSEVNRWDNPEQPDDERIDINQISVTTEEA